MENFGIYIHIPFCMSKCSYCSFISKCATEKQIEEYFKYLKVQIVAENKKFCNKIVTSIYFGGGTPSFVDEKHIENIMKTIKEYYNISKDAEITIECNPCTTNEKKLKIYKKIGINRISFGVQSLNDDCLKIINRKHSSQMAINAIKLAQKVGFDNISCDLLLGIPNQTKQMVLNDIVIFNNLNVKHISAYMLMLEKGTKLYEQTIINKELQVASDDLCVDIYNDVCKLLKKLKFNRYEISNFSKQGFSCKHNENYWDMGEYVGFGVSAHSFYNNMRIAGIEDFEDYYKFVKDNYILRKKENFSNINNENNESALQNVCKNENVDNVIEIEKLTKNQIIEETIMLSLRQTKGVCISKLKSLGFDLLNIKKNIVDEFIKHKIIEIDGDYLRITEENFGASNAIILELLP